MLDIRSFLVLKALDDVNDTRFEVYEIDHNYLLTPVLYTASLYKRTSRSIAFSLISKL